MQNPNAFVRGDKILVTRAHGFVMQTNVYKGLCGTGHIIPILLTTKNISRN